MDKLSTHYRTDSVERLDERIEEYLDKNYFDQLKNLDCSNPKLLVVFSGGNAVGKSTISAVIEDEFDAVVLENDAVKRTLLQLKPDADRDELNRLTWKYTMGLYPRLESLTANGLLVRDGVIDWYFDRILPVFEQAGYELFIVGFDISRNKSIELIKKRGDTPTVKENRFYELLEDHEIHIKRFREKYQPDILLHDDDLFNHDIVIRALRQKLASMQS